MQISREELHALRSAIGTTNMALLEFYSLVIGIPEAMSLLDIAKRNSEKALQIVREIAAKIDEKAPK